MILKSLILVALGGSLLLLAVRRLREYKLKERYALLFLLLGFPFLILAVWPEGVAWLQQLSGIDYRTITLLCVATFLILMVFELLTIVSVQDQKITALAQLVGILMEKHKLIEPEHSPRSDHGPPLSTITSQPQ